jgi:hypothetical protein
MPDRPDYDLRPFVAFLRMALLAAGAGERLAGRLDYALGLGEPIPASRLRQDDLTQLGRWEPAYLAARGRNHDELSPAAMPMPDPPPVDPEPPAPTNPAPSPAPPGLLADIQRVLRRAP